MKHIIFISWESHLRTRTICNEFSLELFEIEYSGNPLLRYLKSVLKTISIIKKKRPRVLIVQNPSAVLAFFVNVMKPFFSYRLFIDAHNEAITPFVHDSFFFRWLAKFNIRHANITIVTNNNLAREVISKGGHPFVLPDLLPTPPIHTVPIEVKSPPPYKLVLICTYAPDEPFMKVIEACSNIDQVRLYVTGRVPDRIKHLASPPKLTFTGYIDEETYWMLLAEAHIIIDLTEMDNCLVCGAYESIALQKPLILSNNEASIATFNKNAIHVENDVPDIHKAILNIISDFPSIKEQASHGTEFFLASQKKRISLLQNQLENQSRVC